jgi:lipopolysaccharide/colanic/teichoic acid biosynthesis glycosyltransferase
VNVRRSTNGMPSTPLTAYSPAERAILREDAFRKMIGVERKRSERSRKPFLLMLVDSGNYQYPQGNGVYLENILSALSLATRETDITGWYTNDSVAGVMFTEIGFEDRNAILSTLLARASETLRRHLSLEQFNQVSISFHVFPEDWEHSPGKRVTNPTLYPDLAKRDESRRAFRIMKRAMDIAGSLAALLLFSPVFLVVALLIKLTSKGPILFSQHRIGQHGQPFVFLKFRSMHVNNNPEVHREYVRKLIAGTAEKHANENGTGVYKLTRDSRITPVGSFLRRTSLDELPQFLNVLQGKMSLVGPRPPVPYEVEAYDFWHRRRVLEAKPGITGLWQVGGRSRVKFDDMVRLDLQYARTWSPWMDLKILLRTPGAVLLGEGAH